MSAPLDFVAWLVQERYLISLFYAIRQNWLLTFYDLLLRFIFCWFANLFAHFYPFLMNICSLAHEHMFIGGSYLCYWGHEHMFVFCRFSLLELIDLL